MKKRVERLEDALDKSEGGGFQPVVVEIDRSIDYLEAQRRSGVVIDSRGRKQVKVVIGGDDAGLL